MGCYSGTNRLATITSTSLTTTYQYDGNGSTTNIDYGGHAGYGFSYDSLGRMKTSTGTTYNSNGFNQRVMDLFYIKVNKGDVAI